MQDRRLLWALGITAGTAWAVWAYFLFIFGVGTIADPWNPWRIVFYVLLVLAPAISFVPLALWLRWPLFAPYAVIGWAVFGGLLAFIPPAPEVLSGRLSPLAHWYFFLALFVVLTTIFAPLAHRIGLRWLTSRTHRGDIVRAWREAGLLSLYIVGLTVIASLGLFTWPIALLSLLFLVLVEALFLARKS